MEYYEQNARRSHYGNDQHQLVPAHTGTVHFVVGTEGEG
jgi:hypothetical protein